jgi:hypothetical protein
LCPFLIRLATTSRDCLRGALLSFFLFLF